MKQSVFESLGWVAVLATGLLLFGEAFWQTNDDPGMAMVVHGFGVALPDNPPWLIHSNIIWGYLLRLLPEIGGVIGYTTGTYLAIGCALTGIHVAQCLLNIPLFLRLMNTALFCTWAFLFPQFSVTAGLCTLAAIALVLAYSETREIGLLLIASVLGVIGFLIRDLQFAFMLLVAMPFLPWRLFQDKRAIRMFGVTGIALATAWWVNHDSYSSEAWQAFKSLNERQTQITDFNAVTALIEDESLEIDTGYSRNDLRLLRNWFQADRELADPERLDRLIAAANPSRWQLSAVLIPFVNYQHLWGLLLATCMLSLLSLNPRNYLAWAIFLIGVGLISWSGRLVPERLIIPIYFLLAFHASLHVKAALMKKVAMATLAAATMVNAWYLAAAQRAWQLEVPGQEEIAGLTRHPRAVVWGDAFRTEVVHRPFQRDSSFRAYHYQTIAQTTWAPFSVTHQAAQSQTDIVNLLTSANGIQLVAFYYQLQMLDRYCQEHQNRFIEMPGQVTDPEPDLLIVSTVRCFRG